MLVHNIDTTGRYNQRPVDLKDHRSKTGLDENKIYFYHSDYIVLPVRDRPPATDARNQKRQGEYNSMGISN